MKLHSLLAAVIAFSLALPGLASADRYDHGNKHGYKQDRGYNKHHRYGNRQYVRRNYYNNHTTHYYRRDNSNEKLLIGLVVGGILGYAINNAQHRNVNDNRDYYPPAQPNAYPADSYKYSNSTCLQAREYQTTVVVGGRNVPAYGTACLQPDGSWRHEPARLVSY